MYENMAHACKSTRVDPKIVLKWLHLVSRPTCGEMIKTATSRVMRRDTFLLCDEWGECVCNVVYSELFSPPTAYFPKRHRF